MHITRLRLLGFKSFVEATELLIEKGLTGVVGPNGCGKSNLLEALRWVMGEASYKSMRASTMEDVIFSGTTARPSRNSAEVTIFIDNSARSAPAELNDSDELEVTRRIERELGSAYRINGREARARDVKILFEDAATGRSLAIAGAAGTDRRDRQRQARAAPPHTRGCSRCSRPAQPAARGRAEAEGGGDQISLASTTCWVRSASQIESLKRQARQAKRYKEISEEIRTQRGAAPASRLDRGTGGGGLHRDDAVRHPVARG